MRRIPQAPTPGRLGPLAVTRRTPPEREQRREHKNGLTLHRGSERLSQ